MDGKTMNKNYDRDHSMKSHTVMRLRMITQDRPQLEDERKGRAEQLITSISSIILVDLAGAELSARR